MVVFKLAPDIVRWLEHLCLFSSKNGGRFWETKIGFIILGSRQKPEELNYLMLVILGLLWDRPGITSGCIWDHFGIAWGVWGFITLGNQ